MRDAPDDPDFLTVDEAAKVLRIGRTAAYQLARRFETSEGREGIPSVRVGRQYGVPVARLEEWAGRRLSTARPVASTTVVELPTGSSVPAARRRRSAEPSPALPLFPVEDAG